MKKLLLSLATLAAFFTVNADDFDLLFDGQPVDPDKTYETGYTIELETPAMTRYKQNSDLFIRGVKGDKYTIEVESDQPVQVCTFGGCYFLEAGASTQKTGVLGMTSNEPTGTVITEDVMIDQATNVLASQNAADMLKNIDLYVTVYPGTNPLLGKTAHVIMRNIPQSEIGGIDNVAPDYDAIKLGADNALAYHFVAPTAVNVYNAAGAMMMSTTVTGSGTLSLSTLAKGVYIYRASGHTGKILVK